MSTITLVRGDTQMFDLVAGVDLSGKEVMFTAKYHEDDVTPVFAKSTDVGEGITVTSAVGGLATVTIDAADWAAYTHRGGLVWDVQLVPGDLEPKTPIRGYIIVVPDVTQAVT